MIFNSLLFGLVGFLGSCPLWSFPALHDANRAFILVGNHLMTNAALGKISLLEFVEGDGRGKFFPGHVLSLTCGRESLFLSQTSGSFCANHYAKSYQKLLLVVAGIVVSFIESENSGMKEA